MSLELHSQESDLRANLPNVTADIVRSYAEVHTTHHLDHCPLPNKDVIVEILVDLMDILYPGYRHRDRLNVNNVVYHVGDTIDRTFDRLATQISRAFCHGNKSQVECTPQKKRDFEVLGEVKALAFLSTLSALRRSLAKDVEAAYAGDPACTGSDEVIFCYPGLEAITVYRLAHSLHELGVPLIPRIMTEWAHNRTGIDIHPGASIGEYFFIDHGTGVVIGETCEIGNWVKLYQGVTLGALSFPKDAQGNLVRGKKRHPTIEDNVVVYAGATILGGETVIGHDCVVGSNVWLVNSVSPGSTVTIEKPRLVVRNQNQI
ncbi:MAG: serine acetyltransferase [Planctomycetia bacterium]|nr:serine acetyltransferase [Planctomycetia bacterium]